jgi:hypothetical protein
MIFPGVWNAIKRWNEQSKQGRQLEQQQLATRKAAWWIWEKAEQLLKIRNELSQAGISTEHLDRALDELQANIKALSDRVEKP